MRGLQGKGVLISGGTRGIGLATARRFLEEGARVFVSGDDPDQLRDTLGELQPLAPVGGIVADVRNEPAVGTLVSAAASFLSRIDVLINNAGIARKAPFLETETSLWDGTIEVNLRGMFLVARAVGRLMAADGAGGTIVNMASTNAHGGEKLYAAYNASKGGVLQLTRTMAVELGANGIRVNCLCPGFIDTPLNRDLEGEEFIEAYARDHVPLGRVGQPEEVAAAYAFLASDEASFINGAALLIDGGQMAVM